MRKLTVIGVTLSLCFGFEAAQAATFIVTSTADTDGSTCGSPCTLRQAINAANASMGADTINFNFSDTVALGSALPVITDTLTIDGTGRSVILNGGGAIQVLQLTSATTLALNSLTIANGRSTSVFTAGGVTVLPASATNPSGGATLNVTNCVFSNNSTTGPFAAGAIALVGNSSLTVTNSNFTGNSGRSLNGDPTVGAIVSFSSGSMNIASSTFENNSGSAGAVRNSTGALTVSGSTFAANSATSLFGPGSSGAIDFNGGTGARATITNSTFYANSAASGGGAIYFSNVGDVASQLAVTNSTFSGNVSRAIAGNLGIVLRNSILEKNTNGNCSASVGDGGGNLSDDASCIFTSATSLASTPAQLGPLQDNGGPTRTMAPLTGSPAIDLGINQLAIDAGLTTDQRGTGFPRISPTGGTVDRGAFEVQVDNTPPTCTATANPSTLLNSNHKLVNITTKVTALDNNPGVAFLLRSVTSSEADSRLGRDDVASDIQGWTVGSADLTGLLRNERYSKTGRIYTITYEAKDVAGNSATCSAKVTVPSKK
jgi:fibronectin-binding autotransporter adhesin